MDGMGTEAAQPSEDRWHLGLLHTLWAREAETGLVGRAPHWSARQRPFPAVLALLGALLPLAGIALAAGASPVLTWPALLVLPVFLVQNLVRILAIARPPRWAEYVRLPDAALPSASLVLALYREAAIIPALVKALKAIDYPADRLQILLVLEAGDRATRLALERQPLDARFERLIVPPGLPQTKPRALNHALRHCRGQVIGVLDAEDRPALDQLRRAAECFGRASPRLACLQAPLNWFNRGECWLTRLFALEYACHFHALLPLYQRLGWPLPLGGTSNYFRSEALHRVGGWDAWNVTEDADLGLRLHRMGYRCGLIEPMTLEEAPISLSAWQAQRTRWLKGYLQTLSVHLGPDPQRWNLAIPLIITLGGAVLSALMGAPMLLIAAVTGAMMMAGQTGATLLAGLMGLGVMIQILTALVSARRAGIPAGTRDLFSLPLYEALKLRPVLRALYQLIHDPYLWEKTEHGVTAVATPTRSAAPCISPSPSPLPSSSALSVSSSSPAGGADSRRVRSAAPA